MPWRKSHDSPRGADVITPGSHVPEGIGYGYGDAGTPHIPWATAEIGCGCWIAAMIAFGFLVGLATYAVWHWLNPAL